MLRADHDAASIAPVEEGAPAEPSRSPAESAEATSAGPPWLSEEEQGAWLGAVAMVLKLPGVLDSQLQREAGIGLFEYLVLSSLSMSEERTARMSELAGLTNGSLSRLSNVVKRLEQRHWVQRRPDPLDGRYTVASLTDSGWDKVVAAAPGHVKAVRHYVLTPLTRPQIRQLRDIGQRVRDQTQLGPPAVEATSDDCFGSPTSC